MSAVAEIAALVAELHLGLDRDELCVGFAARDLLDAKLAVGVAEYEAAGLHEHDGAVSIGGWLRQETGRDACSASKVTLVGRKLRVLPVLREAVLDGRLTGGQLDVVVANVPVRHLARFAEHEAELVPLLVELDVDRTRRVMEDWKRRADALDAGAQSAEHENQLFLAKTIDARSELRGSLDADLTAVVEAALRVADPKDFELPLAERRAMALGQVCQHFLDHQQTRTGGRHRPHLNVVLSYEELCEGIGGRYLDTDQPVSPAALGVLLCDSAYHRLLFSGASGVLDYGRATRAWPVDLYNAIAARDGGCRFGACDAPASWCDVHHVVPVEDGGQTSVTNGAMGCRRHHLMVHKPGYSAKLLADGTLEFTHPDGRVETSHPRGPAAQPLWRERPDGSHACRAA
jgi:hypothetical protein